MNKANWHQYQILTKRADRLALVDDKLLWAPQVWMGVSVEDKEYLWRIDRLRRTKDHIKFLSIEPLLGPLGWLYAGRALVPIREAIRRQREFAADASHELRTPLTVIRGNLRMLAGTRDQTPEQQEALGDIQTEVTRMGSLVEQLLLLARTDSDALELEIGQTDLAEEAADALAGFSPVAASKQVELRLGALLEPPTRFFIQLDAALELRQRHAVICRRH